MARPKNPHSGWKSYWNKDTKSWELLRCQTCYQNEVNINIVTEGVNVKVCSHDCLHSHPVYKKHFTKKLK